MKYILWVVQPDEDVEGVLYEGRSCFVTSDINKANKVKAEYEESFLDAQYEVMCLVPMPQEAP